MEIINKSRFISLVIFVIGLEFSLSRGFLRVFFFGIIYIWISTCNSDLRLGIGK